MSQYSSCPNKRCRNYGKVCYSGEVAFCSQCETDFSILYHATDTTKDEGKKVKKDRLAIVITLIPLSMMLGLALVIAIFATSNQH